MLRLPLLFPLAAAVWGGCLPPPSSMIVKPGAERYVGWFGQSIEVGAERPCALDGIGPTFEVTVCEPEPFEALVRDLAPDRVIADRWAGGSVTGRSVLVRGDTAVVGGEAVPFESLAQIRLVEDVPPGRLARGLAITAAATGALGALTGVGTGTGAVVDGAVIGATAGLALGWMGGRVPDAEPFRVVGWAEPPSPYLRLDTDGDGCAGVTLPGDQAPYTDYAPCLSPGAFETRAERSWVEVIDVHLRSGGRLEGARLALADDAATLDGRRIGYDQIDRIALRHPAPPFRRTRIVLDFAGRGAFYGAVVGAGPAITEGAPEAVLIGAASGAALGMTLGALGALLVPGDELRETATLPTPEP